MKDNIAIIGFMGSGKTTVGKILAERLNYIFIDLDRVIEVSADKSINDIFQEKGENYFRKIESEVIYKIMRNRKCVFACGGGVILKESNMRYILKNCEVVYLMISGKEAYRRLMISKDRPLLESGDREKTICDLLNKREALYLKYSDITIDNNSITSFDAANMILQKIKER